MTRIVVRGGRVFDGTGADPAEGDVAIEDGRIVDVGTGLDGDEAVDVAGRTLLPGLFDCHIHVCHAHIDPLRRALSSRSRYQFFEAQRNLPATLADRHHDGPRRGRRRPRREAGRARTG